MSIIAGKYLPNEMGWEIASRLKISDLGKLAQVCKFWKKNSETDFVWSKVLRFISSLPKEGIKKWASTHVLKTWDEVLQKANDFVDRAIGSFVSYFPNSTYCLQFTSGQNEKTESYVCLAKEEHNENGFEDLRGNLRNTGLVRSPMKHVKKVKKLAIKLGQSKGKTSPSRDPLTRIRTSLLLD
ncbi:MAG: hypothetical protein K940chlam6_01567 [Chlamydiae bacterium]|nr:hypothetical protein [Chlamydiota bacterium]